MTVKHVNLVTRHPAQASSNIGIGQIIQVIAQILTVLGTALSAKDA